MQLRTEGRKGRKRISAYGQGALIWLSKFPKNQRDDGAEVGEWQSGGLKGMDAFVLGMRG